MKTIIKKLTAFLYIFLMFVSIIYIESLGETLYEAVYEKNRIPLFDSLIVFWISMMFTLALMQTTLLLTDKE